MRCSFPPCWATAIFCREQRRFMRREASIVAATVILQDVTRLRRFEELKNDLVATVAHEFRTPLTSLRMAVHLCTEQVAGPLTDKQAELLHAAREDCDRLQAMVDDLLDLSRIESGKVELYPLPTPVPDLIEKAIEENQGGGECERLAFDRGFSASRSQSAGRSRADRPCILQSYRQRGAPHGGRRKCHPGRACRQWRCAIHGHRYGQRNSKGIPCAEFLKSSSRFPTADPKAPV